MGVVQNNVANASTPGYVTQTPTLNAQPFDPADNLWGGVQAGAVQSSRNQYAEENVWNQNTLVGSSTQQASSLSALQNIFSVSGDTGIPAALSGLSSAFSAWSSTPSDTSAQQQVVFAAQGLAQAFNQAAAGVGQIESQTNQQLQSTVSQINQLTAQIAGINGQIRAGDAGDAGLQAQLYNSLETLSGLANIQVQTQSDGTVSVLMGGQMPLVLGTQQQTLWVSFGPGQSQANPGATPDATIQTDAGQDVTAEATGGQLGGLLQFRNTTLPSVIGDGSQQGSLNQLAQSIADGVNGVLESGQKLDGTAGVPLFTYAANSSTAVAQTFSVTSNLTGSDLAPIAPGPPPVANGAASTLANISSSTDPANQINGQTYTQFYAGIASAIGSQQASASAAQTSSTDLLTQAQNLRAQSSGVSLNDQAAYLMQYQQAYEASAQMITTVNSTLQYLMQVMVNA